MGPDLENTLHGRFLRGLSVAGDRDAFRAGEHGVTYADAHATALTWAGTLLHAAGRPPRAVGVLANKSGTAYLGMLAALYTGAAAVPLHPDFPAARTRQAMADAGVEAVITDGRGAGLLAEILPPGHGLPVLVDGDSGQGLRPDPGLALAAPRPAAPSDPAYVMFTSGSTGRPKGVPVSHGSAARYFATLDARYDFTPDDVFSQTFDLTFDCAVFDLFCAWGAGARVQPVPGPAYRALPEYLAEQGVTVWFATPNSIALTRRTGALTPGAMPGLRWSLFAGEPLMDADAAQWQAAAPGSAVENLYGPTELTITCTVHRWSPATSPGRAVNGVVPIGAPHPGLDVFLRDDDGTAHATEGELCVAGPQTCAGYLDPADDAGRFLERDGKRWYRTGDRVRRDPDGELTFLGRVDDQVQLQGWRVQLSEIAHAVRTHCAGVEDAAAVTAPLGGDGEELVVYYTGRRATPVELARGLRAALPQGLVPRRFQHLDVLPLNANRKIDRAGLKARAARDFGTAGEPVRDTRPAPAPAAAHSGLLHDILAAAVAARPDAVALRDGRVSWTYAELAAEAAAAGHWLERHGVVRGDRVVVQLPNTGELVALFHACARRGVTMVPLNPGMKEYALRQVLADCEPALAVTADEGAALLRGAGAGVPVHALSAVREGTAALRGLPEPAAAAAPGDIGVLIYTSGSTAAPKGVVCPQERMAFAARAIQQELGYRADDVVYCRLPLSFDYGLFQILLSALAGAELVLAGAQPEVKLLNEIRECGATVFPVVPSLATILLRLVARAPGDTRLRLFTNTGAALQQATITGLRENFPGARVARMFGITECKRVSIMPPGQELERPGSVGRPLPGTRVEILGEDGGVLPPGEVGEITVTGPHVMAGYWRAPEITARTFRPDPRTGGTRLHTGDYGHLDADGYLYFEGRRDDMFKRHGVRMSTIEIEAAAMDVPGVRAAAALVPTAGRDLTLCVAGDLTPQEIRRELAKRLEPAKVPADVRVLADVPLTLNGKSEKKQLIALLDGSPTPGQPAGVPAGEGKEGTA
ncbi:AMP-dependent synthetase [Streptomyces albireticuli]|uniref:AMP-dependent synthetase n=1 Tax=Streptomyces albireticuli TaxID=1940 RepID=A0A1Z2KZA0_9ACTN|nr:AMP-binding protein [Streptomyces albireticuli]ARZ67350.1 AMP-dependent synthetase [Streptomyces albireticuli]